jgi:hypothetical protein
VSWTINENPEIIIDLPATQFVTCDQLANITATASGGSGSGYSYSWSTGSTANNIDVSAGTYVVTVIDGIGCTETGSAEVQFSNSTLDVTFGPSPLACFQGTETLVPIVTGGIGQYTYEWSNGSTGATLTAVAGNYCVTVTDEVNCEVTNCSTILEADPVIVTIPGPITICDGAQTDLIPTVVGGTPGYTYLWSTGSTNNQISEGDGTYSVTVTDSNPNGCTGTASATVIEATPLTGSIQATNVTCLGNSDGELQATVSGSIPGYNYSWSSGGTSSFTFDLGPGTYSLSVTDQIGCVLVLTADITEPALLEVTVPIFSPVSTCFGDANGSAEAVVTGGTAPYDFAWTPGSSSSSTISGLAAGDYTVTVVDANSCFATADVTITEPTPVQIAQTGSVSVTCNGLSNGGATVLASGGTPGYTYFWPVDGSTSATITGLPAGTYTVEAEDANGCPISMTVTVTEPAPLAVTTGSNDVTCFGYTDGLGSANVSGGTIPYTYIWTPFLGNVPNPTGLAPGTYTLVVNDVNGCQATGSITVGEPAEIMISATSTPANCGLPLGSGTVQVDAAGVSPFTYSWDAAAGGQTTLTATSLIPGTYFVTVTDADGCQKTTNVTVGDIPPATLVISNVTNVSCFGAADGTIVSSISGPGTAPYSYQWFTDAGVSIGQTGVSATNLGPGTYYVVVTDANGCISTSPTATITEPTQLTLSVSNTNVTCFGLCNGTGTAVAGGGTLPYTFVWNDPLQQDADIATSLCAGNFSVVLTDANGCSLNSAITVTQPPLLAVTANVTNSNCNQADGSACVTATGGAGGYTYLWDTGANSSCLNNIVAGGYSVTVTDGNGCTVQTSAAVPDIGGPVAVILNQTDALCFGDCNGTALVGLQGGLTGLASVVWDAAAGGQTTPLAGGLCAGTYTVVLTDSVGCSASIAVTIAEPPILQYNLNEFDPICFQDCNGTAEIIVAGGTTPYAYQWQLAGTGNIGGSSSVTGLCAGSYFVMVTDANGCNVSESFVLANPAPVTATVNITDNQCYQSCDGMIEALPVTGVAPFTFQWDAATGNQTSQTALNLCIGSFSGTVIDANGCTVQVSGNITEPTPLLANFGQVGGVSCSGFSNGFAEIIASGGTPGYTYAWTDGQTGALALGLSGGTYCVTVTDGNGCEVTDCVQITEAVQLTLDTYVEDASCYGYCDGGIYVNAIGGTQPLSYQWIAPGMPTTPDLLNVCSDSTWLQLPMPMAVPQVLLVW